MQLVIVELPGTKIKKVVEVEPPGAISWGGIRQAQELVRVELPGAPTGIELPGTKSNKLVGVEPPGALAGIEPPGTIRWEKSITIDSSVDSTVGVPDSRALR